MFSVLAGILEIFTVAERRRFYALVVFTTIGALIEASSVASILPLLSVLDNPSLIETNKPLTWLYALSGAKSVFEFQLYLAGGVFIIVVGGLLVKALTLYGITKFAVTRGFSISSRLLHGYLRQPYEWYLNHHSAHIGKTVLTEVEQLVSQVIRPAMILLASFVLVVFLVVLLTIAEPKIAIAAACVLTIAYVTIYFSIRKLLVRLGKRKLSANLNRFRLAQEATEGIKYVKLQGLEDNYIRRFNQPAREIARIDSTRIVLAEMPRYFLEMLSFGGVLLFIVVMLIQDSRALSTLVPTLGLIAFAGMRLLPALQKVFSSLASVRGGLPLAERILSDFREMKAVPQGVTTASSIARLSLDRMISLESIQYSYPNAKKVALDGLSITICAKTTVALVGGTGAGKTTIVDLILGLLLPTKGKLRVDGTTIDQNNLVSWQKSLGYVPQTIFLTANSVAENIAFGVPKEEIDTDALERAAKAASLHDFIVEELPDGYNSEVGERGVRLSGGQRQRVGIARALYHDPDVLIFDEATSALDNLTEKAVMSAIDTLGGHKTIIIIAHRFSTIKNCDSIFFLEGGKVTENGTYDELRVKSSAFNAMAETYED